MLRSFRQTVLIFLITLVTGAFGSCSTAPAGRVSLIAVGDILMTRGVGKQIAKNGPSYPFSKIRKTVRSEDIAFFNLEFPFSKRGVAQRHKFLFRADPSLAQYIASSGFDVACLANNHTLDYGRDALLDTISTVEKAGMLPVGAGMNRADACRVRIVRKNRLRVGFIAYSDLPTIGVVRLDDKPTIACVSSDSLADEVKKAKSKCDVLVVSFHWGVEYMKRPTERQQNLAHLAINSGADVILGHHPHVLQPTEVYKGKPILYSMGAFVWDAKLFGADHSAMYVLELGKSSARLVKTIPILIKNCRPDRI